MTMKHVIKAAIVAATLAFGTAQAAPMGYSTPGTENAATYTFTAAADGDVVAYFVSKDAAFVNEIGLWVNGVLLGQGLRTDTAVAGNSLNFGAVSAGDVLTFTLININPGNVGPWYTDKSMNIDGQTQHVYSNNYAGDSLIPAGKYIGFEDQPKGAADFDYNDENFVFTNVAASVDVPEPASLAVMALGLGLMGSLRRKSRK